MPVDKYNFEVTNDGSFKDLVSGDIQALKSKLKLGSNLPDELESLLKVFGNVNLRNIYWYASKIDKENSARRWYAGFTIALVILLPVFIFVYTNYFDSFFDSDLDDVDAISTTLTALLTSLLGLHQLISGWTEKRRFRSLFFKAKSGLMRVLFELENKQQLRSASSSIQELVYDELIEDLRDAIEKSREITMNETQEFFDLSSTPVVNLSNIFSESSTTAKSLTETFASKKFTRRRAALEKQEETRQANTVAAESEIQSLRVKLKGLNLKFDRLYGQQTELADKILLLKSIPQNQRTVQQQAELNNFETRCLSVEAELVDCEVKMEEMAESILLKEHELKLINEK